MAFDPDAYLLKAPSTGAAPPPTFDPDAYLRATSNGIPAPRRVGTRVDQIPGSSVAAPASTAAPERPESGFFGKLMAPLETAVTLGTSAITAPIVEIGKIGGTLFSGKFGTQEGIKKGEETGRRIQQFFQSPVSPESETQTQAIGNALARTGLQGVPLNMMGDLATLAGPAVRQVAPAIKAPLEARQQRIQTQRVKESELAAPRIDAAKDALELGLALDPAVSKPTTANRIRTGAIGTTGLQSNLSKINLPQVSKVAREDMGLPETTKLDAKAFETARNAPAISGAYDKVRALPTVAGDESVLGRIDSLRVMPMIGDTGQAAAVNNFLDTIKGQLQAGTNGETAVKSIRQLRRDAQAIYNQQSAGINPPSPEAIARADINMGVANALESAIENSITDPRLVTDFRSARTALARTYDYERATNLATGVVDPQALASLAAEGRPLSGKLAKLANVAANFPEVTQGGLVREPTWREKATRSGAAGTAGAIIGSPFGLPGAIVGGAAGAAGGNVASALMARRMASPGYQRSRAMPEDYRPIPSGLRPVEPNVPVNALVPYDYSQQTFTPPNFVMQPNQYGPRVTTPGFAPGLAQLPAPSAQGTINMLRAEDARRGQMSRTLGQQAEQQAAAAEAAARRPTSGAVELQINPLTGVPEVATGIKGATPATFQDFGTTLKSATDKATAGRMFDLTAAEKVAFDKTRIELAEAVPGMKALNDKAIAAKMQDRAWVQDAIGKAQDKARAFEDIAARATTERLRQDALMKREQMLDLLETLEGQFSKARPVKLGGQGPKTRAFQRNMLTPEQEIQNALAK